MFQKFYYSFEEDITITDSEFISSIKPLKARFWTVMIIDSIASEYIKRNLNVTKNMFLCMKYIESIKSSYNIYYLIDKVKTESRYYKFFQKELDKYFLFT